MKHRRQVARDIELASFKVVRTLVSSWCWCLPWMVNGCGLITDNDFQISIKTFFTIFYIPYILWLSKKQDLAHSFDGARREYTVHWCHEDLETSGAVWRHRGEGERRSRYSRDNINPYIRIHAWAKPDAARRLEYQIWTKYFPIFLLWMESQAGLSAHSDTRTHFTWCDAAEPGIRSNGCER